MATEVEKRLWSEMERRYPWRGQSQDDVVELQRKAFEAGAVYVITDQICTDVMKAVISDALADFRKGPR